MVLTMARSVLQNFLYQVPKIIEMQLFIFPVFDYALTRGRETITRSIEYTEAVAQRYSVKKAFLKTL